jgi:hypothetical protein
MRRYELENEHWDMIGDLFERKSRGVRGVIIARW